MDLLTISKTITDPDDWDGSLFDTTLELVQLVGEEFRSSQVVTELGLGARLLRLTVNQPVKVRSRPLSLRYVATLFDNSHSGQFAGASIEAGQLLIFPPAYDFDASIKDAAFACTSIFVPPGLLESYYQTLMGSPLEPLNQLKVVIPDPSSIQWIGAWSDLVSPGNYEQLTAQQRLSIQESLRDDALTLLIHSLKSPDSTANSACDLSGKKSRLSKARKLVRMAEDYSNSIPDVNIRMVDLCRATNVSERTLQYAFKTCLGISPMNYLKRHRLHQVRCALKAADPTNTTVSSIASQFGFFHFGDFSQAYKAQFRESPSETLKHI